MRVDDLKTYLAANIAPHIASRTTAELPLVTPTATMIEAHEFNELTGSLMLALDEGTEESEWLTTTTRDTRQTVDVLIFVQGGTKEGDRARLPLYADAVIACLKNSPDYNGVKAREFYDGVEAKDDIKAAKVTFEFRWEE